MAQQTELYDQFSKILELAALDTVTLKAALVTSAYIRAAGDDSFTDDAAASEVVGAGYVAGGVAITGLSVTNTAIDFDNIVFSAITVTTRRLVVYVDAVVDGISKPLLFSLLFDDAPADIVVPGVDLTITVPALGFVTKTQQVV